MKRWIALLFALLLCLTLSGCGAQKASSPAYGGSTAVNEASDGAYMDMETAAAAGELPDTDRKLIYRSVVFAETKEFDRSKEQLDALIRQYGGFVERSSVSGSSSENRKERKSLEYTLRIPAESLFAFLEEMEQTVRVLSCDTGMDDVTTVYIDVEAHLNALTREEARLLELLEQAASVSEVLEIEDRLSYVRYEIESMTAQLKTYDNEIEYSTVTVYLNDVTDYSVHASFGSSSYEAFVSGWNNFVATLQSLVIGLLQYWPFLFLLAAAVVILVIVLKRSSKKNREKFQKRFPPDPPES